MPRWAASRRRLTTGMIVFAVAVVSIGTAAAGERSAGGMATAVPADDHLSEALARERVDPATIARLDAGEPADVIVNYRGDAIRRAVVQAVNRGHGGMKSRQGRRAYARLAGEAYRKLERETLASVGRGVRVLEDYGPLPVQYVRVPSRSALSALLADPRVASAHENTVVDTTLKESLPLIRQPEVAALGNQGADTAVAVLDTGVDYGNAAFGSCKSPGGSCVVAYAQDFAPDDRKRDADGHGTNVAGIVHGVAPQAKILALDVFGKSGAAMTDVNSAIAWVVEHQGDYNVAAMNLSIGASRTYYDSECTSSALTQGFADAAAVGVIPVVSAGNDAFQDGAFKSGVAFPACTPGAIRVGAVYDANVGAKSWGTRKLNNTCSDGSTTADKITCFSQGGPLVGIVAPGSVITAAGTTKSGTSQAAPHVAGAVAVLAAAHPTAANSEIVGSLANTGPEFFDPREGEAPPGGFHIVRRLDLYEAVTYLGDALSRRRVIGNGTVQIGVNTLGHLIAPDGTGSAVGVRYVPSGADALTPGCYCEGWGVGDASSGLTGWADEAAGTSANLNVINYTATATTAVAVVQVGTDLQVTHDYHPSSTPNLYEITVTVRNIGTSTVGDLRYRRVMDWDVPPTEFNEFVTLHKGSSPTVSQVTDDGFASPDPLSGATSILAVGDVVDSGPADHGALFDLTLGGLAPGASHTFTLYYGAAGTELDALGALGTVGADAYSLGQPSTPDGPTLGTPNTFIFGYKP